MAGWEKPKRVSRKRFVEQESSTARLQRAVARPLSPLDEAHKAVKASGDPLIICVTSTNDEKINLFSDEKVRELISRAFTFYAIDDSMQDDASKDDRENLKRYFGDKVVNKPAILIVDSNLKLLKFFTGNVPPQKLLQGLCRSLEKMGLSALVHFAYTQQHILDYMTFEQYRASMLPFDKFALVEHDVSEPRTAQNSRDNVVLGMLRLTRRFKSKLPVVGLIGTNLVCTENGSSLDRSYVKKVYNTLKSDPEVELSDCKAKEIIRLYLEWSHGVLTKLFEAACLMPGFAEDCKVLGLNGKVWDLPTISSYGKLRRHYLEMGTYQVHDFLLSLEYLDVVKLKQLAVDIRNEVGQLKLPRGKSRTAPDLTNPWVMELQEHSNVEMPEDDDFDGPYDEHGESIIQKWAYLNGLPGRDQDIIRAPLCACQTCGNQRDSFEQVMGRLFWPRGRLKRVFARATPLKFVWNRINGGRENLIRLYFRCQAVSGNPVPV